MSFTGLQIYGASPVFKDTVSHSTIDPTSAFLLWSLYFYSVIYVCASVLSRMSCRFDLVVDLLSLLIMGFIAFQNRFIAFTFIRPICTLFYVVWLNWSFICSSIQLDLVAMRSTLISQLIGTSHWVSLSQMLLHCLYLGYYKKSVEQFFHCRITLVRI